MSSIATPYSGHVELLPCSDDEPLGDVLFCKIRSDSSPRRSVASMVGFICGAFFCETVTHAQMTEVWLVIEIPLSELTVLNPRMSDVDCVD